MLKSLPKLPDSPPRGWPRDRSGRLHDVSVTARLGRALGIAFTICFVTGVLSAYQYGPWLWLPPPAVPAWGYRLTQGLHVITGIACIPLLLAKLWAVRPRLTQWPPARSITHAIERLAVGVLVASALLELVTGLLNILQFYPWPWGFVNTHHWLAFVVVGSLLLHIAAQLPKIRKGLHTRLPARAVDEHGITRRGVVTSVWIGVGVVVLTTVGQVISPLAPLALLAPRRPDRAPQQNLPVNRTAKAAQVGPAALSASYSLVVDGTTQHRLTLAELESLPRQVRSLSIACVEGWSRGATWSGPSLLDLVQMAGGDRHSLVTLSSFDRGPYGSSQIHGSQLGAALLATHLNGERLSLDHGYPVRLVAPDRSGVLQTKWINRIEVR